MSPRQQFIVVISRAWMNETGHGFNHSSDMKRFDDRTYAIAHGYALDDSDDFNVATLLGDTLVAVGWMWDDFPTEDAELPDIAAALDLKVRPGGGDVQ
jgi:hypothetical protein